MGKRGMDAVVICGSDSEPAGSDIRVITLEHGEHQDATLYRFDKGSYLQFSPGPSLLGRKVYLYTNYVAADRDDEKDEQVQFVRNQYYGLEWRAGEESLGAGLLVGDVDAYCQLRLERAGAFHYYFVYDTPESRVGPQGSGWFQVAPTLPVPLDGIMCQTVLTKCLGPIPRWMNTLRVAHEAGYNMIHFTPVQELGGSGSSYSLANQLRVDPRYKDPAGRDVTFSDVENVVAKMRADWKMLSICDVVLNHTANETPWLAEQPAATYNCAGCPYLRPAALLDAALARLTDRVASGALEPSIPRRVNRHEHLEAIRHVLDSQIVPELRLHEMYICNIDEVVQKFYFTARNKVPPVSEERGAEGPLRLVPDVQRRRLAATVDMDLALRIYNIYRSDCYDEETRLKQSCAELRQCLQQLNDCAAQQVHDHLRSAVDNCIAGMRYFRLQEDGPKVEEVSERNPLVPRYFTFPKEGAASAADAEAVVYGPGGRLVQAHNGWVMAADPLHDFAAQENDGRVYLRRELIAWGDSVKLRYGEKPEDSPFLWAHMREYVELTAEVFDGVRLDNCHSTPLHVAEYMLDCARNVKPNLYVAAELFTNSDHVDNIFVNRLGITSLIREALNAWDSHEQGRLVHRFGGRAVGSFLPAPRRPAAPVVAHALFLDLTHDNPSPMQKRCLFDLLPSAALVSMASCATGSTRGYDELVAHHVHVVDENRLYAEWSDTGSAEGLVSGTDGLMAARRALNHLHYELAANGYSEVYVDQMDPEVVAVTRHNPSTRKSMVLVAYTAFSAPDPGYPGRQLKPLCFEGQLDEIVLEAVLLHKDYKSTGRALSGPSLGPRGAGHVGGLREYEARVSTGVSLGQSRVFAGAHRDGPLTTLDFRTVLPGTVVAVRVSPHAPQAAAIATLRDTTAALFSERPDPLSIAPTLADLTLFELNILLYCCDSEEHERGSGGVYDIPNHGPLVYAGLQGVVSLLDTVVPPNDLGHPLCANLRAGDWLLDYTWRRLGDSARFRPIVTRYRDVLRPLTELPRFLIPAYYEVIIRGLYDAVQKHALQLMRVGGGISRALALTSVQMTAVLPPATLPAQSEDPEEKASLSAGLPHFATGYMRCWGRDTFISLRGMFIITGRYQDARNHILGFGSCLRHGLIPNLLDGGRNARFNCRDAVWWWLQSIKQYCTEVPDGYAILKATVSRLFPKDDSEPTPPGVADQPLHDVMQEALDVHFQGLVFRERNAGRQIDAHMTDKGFNIQIGIDPETGFPFGGNEDNCGTWMDKMGSSEAAGTRGRPATPRDGSAVELVALAHATASWLAAAHRDTHYPYPGLTRRHRDGSLTAWTFSQWAERIHRSFERLFWIPPAPSAADLRPDLVHRRAIYKDSHGASQPWADYQLRCNFSVAMAISPQLFDPKHAWLALDVVEKHLLGPMGIKTLDPGDWAYRGDYDNSNNSTDASVAHGFNYHQGPEWVWPLGFYIRARLAFAQENRQMTKTISKAYATLAPLVREIRSTPWRGIPELTNSSGAYCRDSCRTQAWSSATALEALYDLEAAQRSRPLTVD